MTNKGIERKWVWIAKECVVLGYNEAAEIAIEIDDALLEIYRDENSRTWIADFEGLRLEYSKLGRKNRDIWEIATNGAYCIACEQSSTCNVCKFRKLYGKCDDPESLYRKFLDMLSAEERGEN